MKFCSKGLTICVSGFSFYKQITFYANFLNFASVCKMAWTGEHRAFIVEDFIKNGESVTQTLRNFKTHFKLNRNDPGPNRKSVMVWVKNFRATGSALKRKPPGRSRSVRTPTNVLAVKESILQSPSRSARRHASALRLSDRTVRRILHLDLKFHPYKMMVVQELHEHDYQTRVSCCEDILRNVAASAVLITSDEAHFHLSGCVNKQNFRYWSESNPKKLHERPLHSERVTVWCAVASFGVWGPYFFEEEDKAVSVTSDRYVQMLLQFLKPKLKELDEEAEIWFQQDGATAHTAKKSMDVLREMFPSHVISLRGDVGWPARSPDLSPCDYFLWGYVKAKVFKTRPTTIEALKASIRQTVEEIPQEMTHRVMENFRNRLQQCITSRGRHLEDVIFKT